MERKSYYLIILLVALVICMGVFWFQFNNNVSTFMILNQTEVAENGSFAGMLMDAYSYGVPNQTISIQTPDHKIINVTTNENGEFKVSNAEYGSGDVRCYSNFTFAGNGKYQPCTYEGNVSVTR
ncbi:MAG: hypothetical protein E7Z81_04370 [Methanobrevibacter sp.]|jgi:hypothetical protein|uniref:hypothetical protein n=1 Tax=Methanobrevibacter sp. TaxID=66852 RepID=UPI0025D1DDF0|nr:hypothetical protein [Methanobrevibacter sp.]MBE6497494.1 hypothetical protein [Methanobrevibacter sp.]